MGRSWGARRRWDQAGIWDALTAWSTERDGQVPGAADLRVATPEMPSTSTVAAVYGSFSRAIKAIYGVEAARGVRPPKVEAYMPRPEAGALRPGERPVPTPRVARPRVVTASTKNLGDALVSWSGNDDRLSDLVELATSRPGVQATVLAHGREVSRSGLVRLLAERMSVRQLGYPILEATDGQQETLVKFASLAADALEDVMAA